MGVEHIGAYSPQARGRSERAFGTLQDRLVKELKLAGIATVEAANAFIRDVYLPAHNARFALEAAGEGSAFVPIQGVDLDEILCVQEERQVGADNCVSYRTLKLQIPESPMRPHFVRARVKVHVHVYSDGSHALFRTQMHRPLRRERKAQGGRFSPMRRLNPLGDVAPWTAWTSLRPFRPLTNPWLWPGVFHSVGYDSSSWPGSDFA